MRLVILMSTYNGSRYLSEQLDSILQQNVRGTMLLVRDDGSSDNTSAILEAYAEQNTCIHILKDDSGNLGISRSYEKLLRHSQSLNPEFIMFSDQDDVWLPGKIKTLHNLIQTMDNEKPALVFSDAVVVDEALNTIASSFHGFQRLNPQHAFQLKTLLFGSPALGCCILFNAALLRKLTRLWSNNLSCADKLPLIVAVLWGNIKYLNAPTVLYRQHQNNACGALQGIHRKLNLRLTNYVKIRFQAVLNDAQELNIILGKTGISREAQQTLQQFIDFFSGSLANRIKHYFKFWNIPSHALRKSGLLLSLMFTYNKE